MISIRALGAASFLLGMIRNAAAINFFGNNNNKKSSLEPSELNEKLMSGGRLFRVCLTGGPCGGKTTLQISVADMFENMGWHVFRSPEVATILLGGGVEFGRLKPYQQKVFQVDILKVILQIEDAYN
ncbi:uncharacterized protein Eint_061610, partial [Encephalitozoon intestinalis ATCC 50506]